MMIFFVDLLVDRSGTAIVTDDEKTIVVDIDKVNFEDGSIEM